MIILEYLFIFFSKTIENALGTLRMIVISNNKKILGAILQVLISLVWIFSTAIVITNFKDIFKVIIFILGCGYGSYLGSYIENKIALGNAFIICISSIKKGGIIAEKLREKGFAVSVIEGEGKNNQIDVLMILIERRHINTITKIIDSVDKKALILTQNICHIQGGYINKKKICN